MTKFSATDIIIIFSLLLGAALISGLAMGDAYGYNKGYKDGFDRALPLTYINTFVNK